MTIRQCMICGKPLDIDKDPFNFISKSRRYAHIDCMNAEDERKIREAHDREELEDYIKKLFHFTTIPIKIIKQIETYVKENNYSYSAIRKTLIYFFEVKRNNIEKSNEGIGIVPYVIAEAAKYWKDIEDAQERNKNVDLTKFVVSELVLKMPVPKREPMVQRRRLFSSLEEESSDINEKSTG